MWWRPDVADERVAGVLSVAYDELSLDLIGSFERVEMMGRVRGYPVLFGISTGGFSFTLIDVVVGNEGLSFADIDVRPTRLLPSSALVGAHVGNATGARWAVASIELERMTAWASPAGLERSLEITEERSLKAADFRYEVPAPVEASIRGASLLIGAGQQMTGDLLHEAGLTVAVEALFTFDDAHTIDEISQRLETSPAALAGWFVAAAALESVPSNWWLPFTAARISFWTIVSSMWRPPPRRITKHASTVRLPPTMSGSGSSTGPRRRRRPTSPTRLAIGSPG
jgi:hypothetical protein